MAAEIARAEGDLATIDRVLDAAAARYAKALGDGDEERADASEEAITGQRASEPAHKGSSAPHRAR
jgi:hypothetical protein